MATGPSLLSIALKGWQELSGFSNYSLKAQVHRFIRKQKTEVRREKPEPSAACGGTTAVSLSLNVPFSLFVVAVA